MKTVIISVAMLLVASAAEAGLRDRCAGSTGARSGPAFSACVSAGIARGEGRESETRAQAPRRAGCTGSRRGDLLKPNC